MLRFAARNFTFETNLFQQRNCAAMGVTVSAELIDQLEAVLKDSADRRVRTLQRLSELLRSCAGRLNPSQVGVFDDVLVRLLDCVGARALAELSSSLADFAAPPAQTVRHLAQ